MFLTILGGKPQKRDSRCTRLRIQPRGDLRANITWPPKIHGMWVKGGIVFRQEKTLWWDQGSNLQ